MTLSGVLSDSRAQLTEICLRQGSATFSLVPQANSAGATVICLENASSLRPTMRAAIGASPDTPCVPRYPLFAKLGRLGWLVLPLGGNSARSGSRLTLETTPASYVTCDLNLIAGDLMLSGQAGIGRTFEFCVRFSLSRWAWARGYGFDMNLGCAWHKTTSFPPESVARYSREEAGKKVMVLSV